MDSRRYLREHTTSKVNLNTGPRGAGKTMLLTQMQINQLIIAEWMNNLYAEYLGTKLFKKPLRVWSNVPVSVMYQPSQDGAGWKGAHKPRLLATLPLNMHKLYAFDEEMQWGFVDFDELDQVADRQDWQNGGQKLFMKILVQVRKLHLSLNGTIQSINWVNPRLMFQIDTTVGCRDSAFTAWGQANDVEPGTIIFTYTRDISGRETGYTYEESGKIYEAQLFGKPLQNLYDTDLIQDPWERYESITVARKKLILDPHAAEEVTSYEDDLKILTDCVVEFSNNSVEKMKRSEFFRVAQSKGLVMNKSEALNYIKDVHGVRDYGSMGIIYLDFTKAKNLPFSGSKTKAAKEAEQGIEK